MSIWTREFWKDTFERVLSTALQVLIAVLSVDGLDLANIDVTATVSAIVVASVLSFAKAVIAASNSSNSVSPASLMPSDKG